MNRIGITLAMAAAVLFGASTPLAKWLLDDIAPALLGGLLYLGSGIGLWVFRLLRDRGWQSPGLRAAEWPFLLGAIGFGGVLGPLALMWGLTSTSAATASLLLNLESVLTGVLAWLVFKENADKRIVLGMAAIVAGGIVLSWQPDGAGPSSTTGMLAIALACLCWAIDNNLTRKVSASDAVFIAGTKGLLAGLVNSAIGLGLGAHWPATAPLLSALALGLAGYGVSLVLFVLALRALGAARTGAYFSTAPFVGAALSLLFLGESVQASFWWACALMALGVWLHLTERHDHEHRHEPMAHSHAHRHDAHHQHPHPPGTDLREPHTHWHQHEALTHQHPHYPDIHHQHGHGPH